MNSFISNDEWQNIRKQKLNSKTRRVSFEEASEVSGFQKPLQIHALWSRLDGDIPQINQLKPTLIPSDILPSMIVLDVLDNGMDFSWRLFGTQHTYYFGVDATGMRMSEAAKHDTTAHQHLPIIKECYGSAQPLLFHTEYTANEQVHKTTYNVALPLADKDGNISRIFGCSMWR